MSSISSDSLCSNSAVVVLVHSHVYRRNTYMISVRDATCSYSAADAAVLRGRPRRPGALRPAASIAPATAAASSACAASVSPLLLLLLLLGLVLVVLLVVLLVVPPASWMQGGGPDSRASAPGPSSTYACPPRFTTVSTAPNVSVTTAQGFSAGAESFSKQLGQTVSEGPNQGSFPRGSLQPPCSGGLALAAATPQQTPTPTTHTSAPGRRPACSRAAGRPGGQPRARSPRCRAFPAPGGLPSAA